jgi:hypothetical protein
MKFIVLIILVLIPSCIAMPLTSNSPLIQDMKKNMDIQSENTIKLSKSVDKISDKLGLDIPSLTPELRDALKQQQADFDKKYDLMSSQMAEMAKKLAEIAGGAVGIPPSVTSAIIGAGTLISGYGGKIVSDIYANRRRERDAQQHAEELAEQEEEKEKIRLRLEREKQELKEKSMVKERTMAKLNPNYQAEWDKCNAEAIAELRAQGKIS